VPCFPHVSNLALLDQLKIPSIAKLLSHAKQIVTVFRVGTFRKVFLLSLRLMDVIAAQSCHKALHVVQVFAPLITTIT
jgi:hypothetical protein